MKFGEKLKQLRTQKGVSQKETAKACGVSERTYIGYEIDGRYPRDREVYSRLADFFNIDQEELEKKETLITWDAQAAEKGGYAHKECHDRAHVFCGGSKLLAARFYIGSGMSLFTHPIFSK